MLRATPGLARCAREIDAARQRASLHRPNFHVANKIGRQLNGCDYGEHANDADHEVTYGHRASFLRFRIAAPSVAVVNAVDIR